MQTIGAARFKEQCLAILENIDSDGIVITKRGKPVAKLMPLPERRGNGDLIGVLRDEVFLPGDVKLDDFFATGDWVSDEWGDLNRG
jgi:antitoxin (DNA-binding transcriptional repressor) of toxin-antitoxin stability system